MEDYLKYFRVQGALKDIFASDSLTSSAIEKHFIVLGTEEGWLYLLNFNGQSIKKIRICEKSAITCISVHNEGYTIACCGGNGLVYIIEITDEKGVLIQSIDFKEAIKCVCLDDSGNTNKAKSIICGGTSGRLIKHKLSQTSQKKDLVLFPGDGSAVQSLSWRGSILAWSDATKVRLMNVDTQSALFYIPAPAGVSIQNTFPCKLFWETDSTLFIGWADKFRQIDLYRQPSNGILGEKDNIVAKSTSEWATDCIIAGISSFDADNVVILGYVPPDESQLAIEGDVMFDASAAEVGISSSLQNSSSLNRIEVQIINRKTGAVNSCDMLQIEGPVLQEGPWAYNFLSSFSCYENRSYSKSWRLESLKDKDNRGGTKGFSPTLFVLSRQDVLCSRVRDVNDRIAIALRQLDFKAAVTLAKHDRHSLRDPYKYQEILALYIDDIMDRGDLDLAAQECVNFIGKDAELWKVWVLVFIYRKCLMNIALLIPISEPRLSIDIYEEVLETCYKQYPKLFLKLIDKWVRVQPQLFNHSAWLLRFQTARDLNGYSLQALALLYLWNKQYEKALNCYLEISYDDDGDGGKDVKDKKAEDKATYMHVFELIEKENLFNVVRDRIVNLIRLSETLSANLLVKRVDQIPVHLVVNQLRGDRHKQLLHWYLHIMFTKFEPYNSDAEYSEFHTLQVILYAEFTPKFVKSTKKINFDDSDNSENDTDNFLKLIEHRKSGNGTESDCMVFLKTSKFYPTDVALDECLKRELYPEAVYLLDIKGLYKHALDIYIRYIGNVSQIINFIESHDSKVQNELWADVVEFSVENPDFLADLLDFLGLCQLVPHTIMSRMTKSTKIEKLRKKLIRIFKHYNFVEDTTTKCNIILEEDALESMRRLNQGQRRAIRVSPNMRCVVCARPLFMTAGTGAVGNHFKRRPGESGAVDLWEIDDNSGGKSANPPSIDFDDSQIWGIGKSIPGSVVVFANRQHCHKICLDKAREQRVTHS